MGWYEREVVPRLVNVTCANRRMEPLRQRALAGVSGTVVELGFGSGANLAALPGRGGAGDRNRALGGRSPAGDQAVGGLAASPSTSPVSTASSSHSTTAVSTTRSVPGPSAPFPTRRPRCSRSGACCDRGAGSTFSNTACHRTRRSRGDSTSSTRSKAVSPADAISIGTSTRIIEAAGFEIENDQRFYIADRNP